jgi:hypothetical protein
MEIVQRREIDKKKDNTKKLLMSTEVVGSNPIARSTFIILVNYGIKSRLFRQLSTKASKQ